MKKLDLSLGHEPADAIRELPAPRLLNVRVKDMSVTAKRGKVVPRGTQIAKAQTAHGADVSAPLAGKISKMTVAFVSLVPDGDASIDPIDFSAIPRGEELLEQLRVFGISTEGLEAAELLIVNGLNTEPGVLVQAQLIKDEMPTLEKGLELVKRLVQPSRCILAHDEQRKPEAPQGCELLGIKAVYPNSLDPLVVKAATGKENPKGVVVVNALRLWQIGRVVETGLPLAETILTIADANWRVPLGTPVGAVLEQLGTDVRDGDILRVGGMMTGESAYSLDQGVTERCLAVGIVRKGQIVPVENVYCINCGECVLHCPARLQPNLITRYAEFNEFEKAATHGLDLCFECGLCAAHCMARRPLLQLIRFAKKQRQLGA
ncbi:4Fe-4S dicluster domain-containing protein [Desulfobaculum bizertense]|uniref:4Fe-4S dicluster domain-containing protein n=1 Tax=Desulfobaculum bizertense TaxID=376490 RepID=UPI001F21A752|nr:4Fe-4S dicluster domain-containing protein [Desulfobaculum bizertense]UIJ38484.1 4Fe-4S dicluster domain-containing protein [Desulfobaculum bizertense]